MGFWPEGSRYGRERKWYVLINIFFMLNTKVIILLILIGLVTGGFGGLLGISGGLLLIPSLVYFLDMNQHQAIGTSLAVMLPPIGIFAAWNYYKAGHVNIQYALILAAAFMIGSYFTSKIAVNIPENILRKIFAIMLLAVSVKMFFTR